MASFAIFLNLPQCIQQPWPKYSFPQIDFIIFRNFSIQVSSGTNLVSGKRIFSENLRKRPWPFLLLLKMAVREHGGGTLFSLFIKIKTFLQLIL